MGTGRLEPRRGARKMAGALIAMALLAALPLRVASADEEEPPAQGAIERLDRSIPVPGEVDSHAVWSKGRRFYQFVTGNTVGATTVIHSYDLDTFAARETSAPLLLPSKGGFMPELIAVDEAGGRIYLPVVYDSTAAIGSAEGISQKVNCPSVTDECLSHILILDAATLREVGRMPLLSQADVRIPVAAALSWSPARKQGDRDKLMVLLYDGAYRLTQQPAPTGVVYATQWDPGRLNPNPTLGNLDWAPVRLDVCRFKRLDGFSGAWAYSVVRGVPAEFGTSEADPDGGAIYAGCYGSGYIPQLVKLRLDANGQPATQDAVVGPATGWGFIADAPSERILLRVGRAASEQWWVFDGRRMAFVAVIGVSDQRGLDSAAGLDPDTGRFYMMTADHQGSDGLVEQGALTVADIRRTSIPRQPFPDLAAAVPLVNSGSSSVGLLAVDSAAPGRPTQVLFRPNVANPDGTISPGPSVDSYRDTIPVSTDPAPDRYLDRTVDIDEKDGVTSASYTGTASGFGARAIFVGGLEAVPRNPQFDFSDAFRDQAGGFGPCGPPDREIVLGSTGPAELTENGSEAQASAKQLDPFTKASISDPALACGVTPPPEEDEEEAEEEPEEQEEQPTLSDELAMTPEARCTAAGESQTTPDPRLPGFVSEVDCDEERTTAAAYARPAPADAPVNVAQAYSMVEMRRDPKRGIVVVVTSVARGIHIEGGVSIDSVVARAESWANGRVRPDDAEVSADCATNRARTAGTCFDVSLFGVTMPGYSCGSGSAPCGDERRAVQEMNQRLAPNFRAAFRSPDDVLRVGSDNGYQAGIQRPFPEREPDKILNNDFLEEIVPSFEVIRASDGNAGRGRQIYQFGGVAATSSYGIQLLAGDADAAIDIKLQDGDEKPLAGGVFEVHQDLDDDGVIGLDDPVLKNTACVTTDDGTGNCTFDQVAPGPYVIHQKAAPAGYAVAPEDFPFQVAPGTGNTVVVTNLKAVGAVALTLTDDTADARPLAGGEFALLADDGDGQRGPADKELETCTTDDSGECEFEDVPIGALLLQQSAAPEGFAPAEDIAFALTLPGQRAEIAVVNGPPGSEGSPDEPGTPDTFIPGTPGEDAVELIDPEAAPEPVVLSAPLDAATDGGPGGLRRLLSAPGNAARWLVRSPGDALLFGAVWALLIGAAVLVVRRRSLGQLVDVPTG